MAFRLKVFQNNFFFFPNFPVNVCTAYAIVGEADDIGRESSFLNRIEVAFDLSEACWRGADRKNVFHNFKQDLKHKHR